MCVCVCLYVSVCVAMIMFSHVHVCPLACVCARTCMRVCVCVFVCLCVRARVCPPLHGSRPDLQVHGRPVDGVLPRGAGEEPVPGHAVVPALL